MMRRGALLLAVLFAALSAPGWARADLRMSADEIGFYAGPLALIARGGVRVDGPLGSGGADAAYVDLRHDVLVLAGHAHLGERSGDALSVDLDARRVDALSLADGAPAAGFEFPDLDPRDVYIRSRHATVVAHASVRFTPASFPTSAGAVPVPSYLYDFADNSGFAAQSLPGASFDQPYPLFGTPSSLIAAHVRYVQGTGGDLALDHHLVDGNRAFLVSSLDAPTRTSRSLGLNGYRRLGLRSTAVIDGAANSQSYYVHLGQTGTVGAYGIRLDTSFFSGGGAVSDFTLRTPDRPLFGAITYRLQADFGMQYQRGGTIPQLPDARAYQTLWHHGLDAFFATPQFHGPFGTSVGLTFDASHTWYAFPHARDAFSGTATMARRFGALTATAIYAQAGDYEEWSRLQGTFYPTPTAPLVAPDGTLWPGYAAYTGASTSRLAQLGLQLVTSPTTTYRLTYSHTDDFPQFHGFGRPVDSIGIDTRFRIARNIGLDLGRSYDFAWGGTRWVPTWTFAVLP